MILFEGFSCIQALLYLASVFKILVTQGAFWSKLLQEQIEEALPEGVMGR
jgi:hypothetical protein